MDNENPGALSVVIDHCAIWVRDLKAMRDFYCEHFGARAGDRYHNPRTGLNTYFLNFDGGARLELMHRHDKLDSAPAGRAGWAHVALGVGSEARVDELARRLQEGGVDVISGPRRTGDGYYEAVVLDPEGNEIELVADGRGSA